MKLQTQIPVEKAAGQMDYQSRVVLLGSCFSKNIGDKLDYYKFSALSNPFGTLFHIKAIERLIGRSLGKDYFTEKDVFEHNGRWHSFDAHSDLSADSKAQLITNLNTGLDAARDHIVDASHIILTLGTAWAYRHIKTDRLVANCHKLPQKEFSKELISVNSTVAGLRTVETLVRSFNKNVRLLYTVSPVRHLKDGFVENQRSKANLFTAIHSVLDSPFGDGLTARVKGHYFPSYEIMMDELRDYRFYNTDMVHPNGLAIDYIWEKFKYVWISEEVYPMMEKVARIQRAKRHRPFNAASVQHKQFVEKQRQKIEEIQNEYPHMKF